MIAVKPDQNLWARLLDALTSHQPSYRIVMVIVWGSVPERKPINAVVWKGWRALDRVTASVAGLNDIAARSRRPNDATAVYYEVEEITNG